LSTRPSVRGPLVDLVPPIPSGIRLRDPHAIDDGRGAPFALASGGVGIALDVETAGLQVNLERDRPMSPL